MRIAYCWLLLLAWVAGSAQTGISEGAQESRVLALENSWNQALQPKDVKAIGSLLAGEFIDIEYDGTVMNKAEYLASVKAPTVHLEHIVNESMQVQFYGKSAVVRGLDWEKGTTNGKPFLRHERFADTWINRNGVWTCVASQSTLIAHQSIVP
jgi:hypothetical protein